MLHLFQLRQYQRDLQCIREPYQCSGYVLPTDAEWEYAARSGMEDDFWTSDGGGDYSANTCTGTETIQDGVSDPLLRDYAWYCGNNNNQYGVQGSKEVGQKSPNGFDLDMHGNIWSGLRTSMTVPFQIPM